MYFKPVGRGLKVSSRVHIVFVHLDDAACEAVLRTFIAEDLERAERLLRRAKEQLGGLF